MELSNVLTSKWMMSPFHVLNIKKYLSCHCSFVTLSTDVLLILVMHKYKFDIPYRGIFRP